MTEAAKTCVFIAVAVISVLAAFAASREPAELTKEAMQSGPFTKIEEASDVASLEIVEFDDATGKADRFKVVLQGDRYVIPPLNYPADAKDQLEAAAGNVMEIDVLNVEEDDKSLHDDRGLVDPLDPTVGAETDGDTVGMRIRMEDGSGTSIADFIVGHLTETAENVRYARRTGSNQIFTIVLNTENLTTEFDKWIEKDLLMLDPLGVRGVTLEDYSIIHKRTPLGKVPSGVNERAFVQLSYDAQELKWNLDHMRTLDERRGRMVPVQLAANQEINGDKLNALKNALDDLKIVDVKKKPADLMTKDRLDRNDRMDLASKGFFFNGQDLLSEEGTVSIAMASGATYVLRFGRIKGSEAKASDDEAGEGAAAAPTGQDIHRYLWVMAQLDLDRIPKPSLLPVPPMPTAPEADGEAADGDAEKSEAVAEFERLKAAREKVMRSNARKQSEYEAKVNLASEEVARLNERFDDWYYVIADDTYQKIHLGADDIVKEKELSEEEKAAAAAAAEKAKSQGFLDKALNFGKSKLGGLAPPQKPEVQQPAAEPAAEKPAVEPPAVKPAEPSAEVPVEQPADDPAAPEQPSEPEQPGKPAADPVEEEVAPAEEEASVEEKAAPTEDTAPPAPAAE